MKIHLIEKLAATKFQRYLGDMKKWLMAAALCVILIGESCRHYPEASIQELPVTKPVSLIDSLLILQSDSVLVWLDSMQMDNGLLQTNQAGILISLYDNALAVCAFLSSNQPDRARRVLEYFNARLNSEMLIGTGGYFQFRTSSGPQGNRWLGDNAWLLIAIHNYEDMTGDYQFAAMRDALEAWIRAQQDLDGGVNGGTDAAGVVIGKITEGMIDAFNAVRGFDAFHEGILSYLEQQRWDVAEQLPVSWPGSDYYYALDNFSWGYCTFEGFPNRVLDEADRFLNTQLHIPTQHTIEGYCFDEDLDVIWLEGSSQMAIAYLKSGNASRANTILHEVAKTRVNELVWPGVFGIPYATNLGTGYGNNMLWPGVDMEPATAACCWFIMACREFDPMELNYAKGIPENSKFW